MTNIPNFTKNPDLKERWNEILDLDKLKNNKTRLASICQKHFTDNDFAPMKQGGQRRHLKKGAFPSRHLTVVSSLFSNHLVIIDQP